MVAALQRLYGPHARHQIRQSDAVDQLRQLAELHDSGVVNAPELDAEKTKKMGTVNGRSRSPS